MKQLYAYVLCVLIAVLFCSYTEAVSAFHKPGNGNKGNSAGNKVRAVTNDCQSPPVIYTTNPDLKICPGGSVTFHAPKKGDTIVSAHYNISAVNGTVISMVTDNSGNIYYIPGYNGNDTNPVYKVGTDGSHSVFAGSTVWGTRNGYRDSARFLSPTCLGRDKAGNIYVGERWGNALRRISPDGMVTTLTSDGRGFSERGPFASFLNIQAIAADGLGNLYTCTAGRIIKIRPNGEQSFMTDAVAGTNLSIFNPRTLAADSVGNLYYTGTYDNRIGKVSPDGLVSIYAGSYSGGYKEGPADQALFSSPYSIALDKDGSLYVSDNGNFRIRKIDANGMVSTVAGSSGWGIKNGLSSVSLCSSVLCLSACADGNVYFADGFQLRKIFQQQPVDSYIWSNGATGPSITVSDFSDYNVKTVIAGCTSAVSNSMHASPLTVINHSHADTLGPTTFNEGDSVVLQAVPYNYNVSTWALSANFGGPSYTGITAFHFCKADTCFYIAQGSAISKVTASGVRTYVCNNRADTLLNNGPLSSVSLKSVTAITSDSAGNLYLADNGTCTIRKISTTGMVTTLAGNGHGGTADGPGSTAQFSGLKSVAADPAGNVYIVDKDRIRKLSNAGIVSTFAGSGQIGFFNGPVSEARFNDPSDIVFDKTGNLFVCDRSNNVIRKISAAGIVSTFAGGGNITGENCPARLAELYFPSCLSIDKDDNLYFFNNYTNDLRSVSKSGFCSFVSSGGKGYFDGTGSCAQFYGPACTATDNEGAVYVADSPLNRIRKVTDASNYLWSNGETGRSITVKTSGNYSLSIPSENCAAISNVIHVRVRERLLPPEISMNTNGDSLITQAGGTFYTWYLNGIAITGYAGQSIPNLGPGTYTVVITYSNGQITPESAPFVILGIGAASYNTISLMPNPATGSFGIAGIKGKSDFIMYNNLGQVVLSGPIAPGSQINILHLPAGIYTVSAAGQRLRLVKAE
ncbi:MAG: T9SS type A sorting domain-containing protein [Bacteroidota bacterium]